MNPAKKKAATEGWIVGGLALVFVVVLVNGPLKAWQASQRRIIPAVAAPASGPAAPARAGTTGASPAAAIQEPPRYTAADLRDPLREWFPEEHPAIAVAPSMPAAPPALPPAPKLQVNGLVWGGLKPKAIIDGEIYALGDMVHGWRITEIGRRGVTLEHSGFPVVYPLTAQGASQTASARPAPRGRRE